MVIHGCIDGFSRRIMFLKCSNNNLSQTVLDLFLHAIFKGYSALGVHYRDLQARVHEQETRNLTLHEAQPSAVLNFEFLVRERVLVNPDNARTKRAENFLIFNLSKR